MSDNCAFRASMFAIKKIQPYHFKQASTFVFNKRVQAVSVEDQDPLSHADTLTHPLLLLTLHTCLVTQALGVHRVSSLALPAPSSGLISQGSALWLKASPSVHPPLPNQLTHTSPWSQPPFRPHKAPIVRHNAGHPLCLSPVSSARFHP